MTGRVSLVLLCNSIQNPSQIVISCAAMFCLRIGSSLQRMTSYAKGICSKHPVLLAFHDVGVAQPQGLNPGYQMSQSVSLGSKALKPQARSRQCRTVGGVFAPTWHVCHPWQAFLVFDATYWFNQLVVVSACISVESFSFPSSALGDHSSVAICIRGPRVDHQMLGPAQNVLA